jgi:hypothetical protein
MNRSILVVFFAMAIPAVPSTADAAYACRWKWVEGDRAQFETSWVRVNVPQCEHNTVTCCGDCGLKPSGTVVHDYQWGCDQPATDAIRCECMDLARPDCGDPNDPLNADCELRLTDPFESGQ